ncbi:uncharacterized protein E0L32_008663 [Thyridium curvatum]|uniref:AMP-dependent synthetase/ligase domain-containing protein n=1 Tax=Thyridium curvatum TaxID=1093900 RepID=A0A507AVC0_9PEZI|nr:uncharacterized protein E0L32_008663 [Thyridium curvatum]TPX10444.1 hypothetical protein E0L32_008663 [Thyridium curvatum]
MASATVPRKLWEHPDPKSTAMYKFMQQTFQDLHQYSISQRSAFWSQIFDSSGYIYEGSYDRPVDESAPIDAVPRWFEGVRVNFAENMLYPNANAPGSKRDADVAVTSVREGGGELREATWGELRAEAAKVAAALAARGLERGDRVVVVGANSVETLLVWLGTSWLGGIFSSSSTDMGVTGILQRAVQVNPKLVFMDDSAIYNGKTIDLRDKMTEVMNGMKECSNLSGIISVPRFAKAKDVSRVPRAETWASFLGGREAGAPPPPPFVRIPFSDPYLICYSSGTTGMPKAIVHSVGGCMVNYFKEGHLHERVSRDTVAMQYTTTGWIMYVAAVAPLLFGARAVLYDGSPFQPDARVLARLVERQRVTKLGISPRWMFEFAKAGLAPRDVADVSSLEVVTSTGMVLSDQLFEWFYDRGFPAHVQLGNISGGTDIAGCFGLLNPLTPVYVGGTQGPSLGVDVRIFDSLQEEEDGAAGREVDAGTPGELVAAHPFPNVPCFFWGDGDGPPPGPRYRAAYFARFRHVWAHGDFCAVHPATGSIAFLGRADGVLNPSGVRFGSAEIYGVVERRFADRVAESLCVGQRRPGVDHDERVVLFLLMRPGHRFDGALVRELREAISRDLSKRHVPRFIFETPEIPTTINGKKVELPVKQIVSGQKIKASGTLANPQSLEYYYQFAQVEELVDAKGKL